MYSRRQKDMATTPPLVVSSQLGNVPLHFENFGKEDDLPITLRKGKMSCTNHLISNFVSYKSLDHSYMTFVNSLSFVPIPSNLKEAVS